MISVEARAAPTGHHRAPMLLRGWYSWHLRRSERVSERVGVICDLDVMCSKSHTHRICEQYVLSS
jgi:hypothetical protein